MHGKTNIAGIAQAAGVSAAAVSRVLSRDATFRVSEATRWRIERTSHDLGYVTDIRARQLRQGVSSLIGVLADNLRGRYLTDLFHHLNTELPALRQEILIGLHMGQPDLADHHIASFRAYRTRAVVLLMHHSDIDPRCVERLVLGARECGPTLAVCFTAPPPPALPGLTIDMPWVYAEFARLATGANYAQALLVTRRGIDVATARIQFKAALARHPTLSGGVVPVASVDPEQVARAACRALQRRRRNLERTAMLTTVDSDAVAITQALGEAGVRVPEDVGVVGYGNLNIDLFVRPRITTFDITGTIPAMARRIVELLRSVKPGGRLDLAIGIESFQPSLLVKDSFIPRKEP